MKIGYARVSTIDQNLDSQVDALKAAGCERIFEEKMSGKRNDRPVLNQLISKETGLLRPGDILVVYKLDRLGRSTFKLLELTEYFEEAGIGFESLQDKIDTTTAVGKAMFRMLAVLAEMERDIIVERTQAGLKAARARGRIGGRPQVPEKDIERALKLYDSNAYTVTEIVEMTGISKATIYRALKNRRKKEQD